MLAIWSEDNMPSKELQTNIVEFGVIYFIIQSIYVAIDLQTAWAFVLGGLFIAPLYVISKFFDLNIFCLTKDDD